MNSLLSFHPHRSHISVMVAATTQSLGIILYPGKNPVFIPDIGCDLTTDELMELRQYMLGLALTTPSP